MKGFLYEAENQGYVLRFTPFEKKNRSPWVEMRENIPMCGTHWFICCSFYLEHFILLTYLPWKTVSRQRHVQIYILDQRSVGLLGNTCLCVVSSSTDCKNIKPH